MCVKRLLKSSGLAWLKRANAYLVRHAAAVRFRVNSLDYHQHHNSRQKGFLIEIAQHKLMNI